MGADTITVTPEAIAMAKRGIMMQMEATTNMVEKFGTMSAAMDAMNMWDFVDNQARVCAAQSAWATFYQKHMRAQEFKS